MSLLLQRRVLRLGFVQDGDVGVGVFPEPEEILVGGERPDAGGVGIRPLRGSRLQGIGASYSQMCQRSGPAVPDDPAVVENLLKLGGSSTALSGCQVCFSAYIGRIEAGNIHDEPNLPQLDRDRGSSLQGSQGGSRILLVQRQLPLNRRQPKRLHLGVQRKAVPYVLRQRFGSCRIAPHGKGKRGFELRALTGGSQPPSLCRSPPGFRRVARSGLT